MMNKEFIRAKKFDNCCFMPWGLLTMVKSLGMYFLTIVKMASSLLPSARSSAKMEESHLAAIVRTSVFTHIYFH